MISLLCGVGLPFLAEKIAYRKLARKSTHSDSLIVSQGYGWRILWDMAYFLVMLGMGYRLIFLTSPLSLSEWTGYAAFLYGILLRIWSLQSLGRFYDSGIAIKMDHQLVEVGPYRVFRHPLHMGTLLKIAGLSFFSPLWIAIPTVLISLLLVININRIEDDAHMRSFGPSFNNYYMSTWDIVDLFFVKLK